MTSPRTDLVERDGEEGAVEVFEQVVIVSEGFSSRVPSAR